MYSMMAVANPKTSRETVPALTHAQAVARLTGIVTAMAELDRQIERCTDPRTESCLLTLRVEHEVAYLEALYGWAYEGKAAVVVH
jgi:hypothetical protein